MGHGRSLVLFSHSISICGRRTSAKAFSGASITLKQEDHLNSPIRLDTPFYFLTCNLNPSSSILRYNHYNILHPIPSRSIQFLHVENSHAPNRRPKHSIVGQVKALRCPAKYSQGKQLREHLGISTYNEKETFED
jgi:hypothetical protein